MDWRADFNCRPMEAQHTGSYLWGHIISLCEALHARRIVDIGCGNGALCHELADHGYEVVGCEPSAESLHFAQLGAPGLVFHRLGVDDDPSVVGNENFDTFQSASFREATASARRSPDHQHPVSRLSEESHSCTHQQVGRASQPILGWWPHQVLVVQDTVPIVERKRFPCRSVHRSGSITFSLEEHDCGRTETSFRIVARRVSVAAQRRSAFGRRGDLRRDSPESFSKVTPGEFAS
jgi:SAM-dependent methyltransferase